jgi:hypothetical protein
LSLGMRVRWRCQRDRLAACEHAGDLHMLPAASGDCPYGCLNCNLEAHAPDILLSLPSISRTAEFNEALEALVKMSVAEWSPDPLDVLPDAEIDAPPLHCPQTEWGVWRL